MLNAQSNRARAFGNPAPHLPYTAVGTRKSCCGAAYFVAPSHNRMLYRTTPCPLHSRQSTLRTEPAHFEVLQHFRWDSRINHASHCTIHRNSAKFPLSSPRISEAIGAPRLFSVPPPARFRAFHCIACIHTATIPPIYPTIRQTLSPRLLLHYGMVQPSRSVQV